MPDVYEGNRPYIFVSYAHADDDAVMPLLEAFVREGYRVWWDRGIELARPFPDYIADHVVRCECFVPLLSRASLASAWCCKEIEFANRYRKRILPVYLEDVELSLGLDFQIGSLQALYRFKFSSDKAFCAKLFGAKVLDPCLTPEGARRRGAKARGPQPEVGVTRKASQAVEASSAQTAIVQPDVLRLRGNGVGSDSRTEKRASVATVDRSGGASSAAKRDKLADYSWLELKELSWAIAAAASDVEGLEIAKACALVDKNGKLRGETKAVVLKDGTKTSVRILGFRHDELAGGGKAGISFEFADVPARHCMNAKWTNEGGWEKCEMRGWLNGDFLGLLPDDLRESVAEARKRTNNRGEVKQREDTSVVTKTTDRLWLLSMSEVYGKLFAQGENVPPSLATYDAEGTQYQLYADKGVTTKNYGFCKKRGADSWWWLRSPLASDSRGFPDVHGDGGWYWDYADRGWGVSPDFCF